MEDFEKEGQCSKTLQQMKATNTKTGKDITSELILYMEGKITQSEFEKRTKLDPNTLKSQ